MKIVKYKSCRAHAGHLVHAVPMRESDPTKVGAVAVCGKNAADSRRPVWYLDGRPVNCTNCLHAMACRAHTTYEQLEIK